MSHSRSLNPILGREDTFLVLFSELMKKRQVPATPLECNTELASIRRSDIVKISRRFLSIVMSNSSEEEAITRCIDKYPMLKALNEAHSDTFEEMLVLTALRTVKDSRKYAKMRLIFCAVLSIFGAITDIYMTFKNFRLGAHRYAYATILTLATAFILQINFVCLQNRKEKWFIMLREMAYVLFCIKPGIDAMRVASDTEFDEDTMVDPQSEMMYLKTVEIVFEAIPGTII